MTAALDRLQQDDHERERRKQQQEQHTSQVSDASIESLAGLASALTEAVLIAHGFHQHKRQWRKKRA
jgi:hypothetical protein